MSPVVHSSKVFSALIGLKLLSLWHITKVDILPKKEDDDEGEEKKVRKRKSWTDIYLKQSFDPPGRIFFPNYIIQKKWISIAVDLTRFVDIKSFKWLM